MLDFDAEYGTDTEGLIGLTENLEITSPNLLIGTGYEPIDVPAFEEVVNLLSIDFSQYTFIDIGCGKGRAVLLASRLPFSKIIGIDFSPKLLAIASKNCAVFGVDERVQLTLIDAVDFRFPSDPLVVYMNNPFERPVMAVVMGQLELSLRRYGRDAWLIYCTPILRDVIETVSWFRCKFEKDAYAVYKRIRA